jgi:hypothetical protein
MATLTLHERLIARQSDAELERKAAKAWMRKGKLWTQEEIDAADREAQQLIDFFAQSTTELET